MSTARSEVEDIAGVAGVRFRTNVEPDAPAEQQLRGIQQQLTNGNVAPANTEAHLNYFRARSGQEDVDFISLWVPKEQEGTATNSSKTLASGSSNRHAEMAGA
jgi:hypothetical protein